jgi:3-isopropylmalate/(R)-2-methylmalate dehydratase small subunit
MTPDAKIVGVKGPGIAVPGNDIDTDRIMPARYLKCVTFEHIGQYAFQDERFTPEGKPKGHPFDDPKHKGAMVLVVNKNFGCGSSREHAPQGLHRWGIKVLVGESFAEIFAGNCAAIGLPAVTASEADVKALQAFTNGHPGEDVTVDLSAKTASFGGRSVPVEMREGARRAFLEGTWDSTAILLESLGEIKKMGDKLPYLPWTGV